jgi:hypothetical protein
MKRLSLLACLALACLAALACASHDVSGQHTTKVAPPELELTQLSGPADQNFPPGLFQVRYAVAIENHSGQPLTLTRLELQPMGGGGPYRLRRDLYAFHAEIAPGATHQFTFLANAYSTGTYNSVDAYAPVSVRGVATFESPAGPVRKIFVKVLPQDRTSR